MWSSVYSLHYAQTSRLKIGYYRTGTQNHDKLLLIHGNLSSSVFFLPLFRSLGHHFDVVAPDLRGFGDTEPLPIDATRGYRDWSDDLASFVKFLGWDHFSIAGWSLGGDVAMQYAIDYSENLDKMVLIAPGSPFGFGGTRDEKGTPLEPIGLASGGGCASANPSFLMALSMKSHLFIRDILNELYFQPPFRMPREWEDLLVDGISKIRIGRDFYPGDSRYVLQWPFVAAGDHGVLNAMSPQYGNLSRLVDIWKKPPILWVRGSEDLVVSDHSMLEFGALGSSGLIPGWPGSYCVPPQPMVAQTRYLLNKYQDAGGSYQELVIQGGHMCCLESPQQFLSALGTFILGKDVF